MSSPPPWPASADRYLAALLAWMMAGPLVAMPSPQSLAIAEHVAVNSSAVQLGAKVAPSPPGSDASILGMSIETLKLRRLEVPVRGVSRADLKNTFDDRRGGKAHEAIDIAAPRGTPVVAVDDGRIVKLFKSAAGGLTVYQFDRDQQFTYYYAHLDRYAEGLREGKPVTRGEVIGFVGSSGNAAPDAPHLHFSIFKLGPALQWWTGTPLNPYPVLTGP